jgi:hypothetical protein
VELRHLRYIVEAADAGSFGRAARRLHVAPQALAAQVADVERELGVALFLRTKQGVRPSAAGEAFVADARQVLRAAAAAAARARRAAGVGALLAVASVELGFTSGVRAGGGSARCKAAVQGGELPTGPGRARRDAGAAPAVGCAQWEGAARRDARRGRRVYGAAADDPDLETRGSPRPLSTASSPSPTPSRAAAMPAPAPRRFATWRRRPAALPARDQPGLPRPLFAAFSAAGFGPRAVGRGAGRAARVGDRRAGRGGGLEPARTPASPHRHRRPRFTDFACRSVVGRVAPRPLAPAADAFLRALRP